MMPKSITTFADWVRQRRRTLDLTQAELASRIGCAVVTLRKIEQATRRPSLQLAGLLAQHLAIPAIQQEQFLRLARGEYVEKTAPEPNALHPPSFLQAVGEETSSGPFMAREQELADLETHLTLARNGNGHVVFVTGEAGSGKTTLVQEFSRRAQETHSDLIVVAASCHSYHGLGDPFLPFRQIMRLLTGGVEAPSAAGLLSRDHVLRLWHLWPQAVEALVEHGPVLIDTFVPARFLIERAATHLSTVPGWLVQLHEMMAREPVQASGQGLQQRVIFDEYSAVLAVLATQQPLLLILDDLHWADLSSLSLLFHLARRLGESRVLIAGTYRPEDVTRSHTGDPHPLPGLVAEFRRTYGKIGVDLDQAKEVEGRRFLDALLDDEPNRLCEWRIRSGYPR
jgi:transcriptional regulator with XRE-family HTH domain